MKKLFTFLFLFLSFMYSVAQWSPSTKLGESIRGGSEKDEYFTLDINQLRGTLKLAQEQGNYAKPVEVNIPVLGEGIKTFEVYSLPVMVKELANQYELGSYVGVAKNDPSIYIRFSVAPNDFQSMIVNRGVYQFIDPIGQGKTIYRVHPKTKPTGDQPFACTMDENILTKKQIANLYKNGKSFTNKSNDFSKNSDKKYRTLRLALSVTGEYTTYFGGTTGAMTAINATLTRVNGVFEKDFALHLNLQNFPALIYTNAATDPYSPAAQMNNWNLELQNTLTTVVTNANYDIGHLFGASGGGGNAGCIGCICVSPTTAVPKGKGSGFTSPADGIPSGDNFDIDYVAHEMGHQFGGNHTFSHSLEGSGVNVEPGSGSTIMGYAGITGANTDVQAHSDAYFHTVSINQIQTNLISKTCDVETPIANNPPVIGALPTYNIPKGTAFVLSANVTDPENDPMTFTWEEVDDAATTINKTNLGNTSSGAAFRSLLPTTSPTRYFPKLSSVMAGVLNNSTNTWEAVSTVARSMNFAITARDNNANATQQQTQNAVQNIIVGNDGPFKVTSTSGYNNLAAAFTWDVVNTNAAPYNVANVKIDYTTDNGITWTTLIASTPNDGSENLTFTGVTTGTVVKARVSAINNVFYAVGPVTISQTVACSSTAPAGVTVSGITQTQAVVSWNAATGATYIVQYRPVGSTTWTSVPVTTNTYTITGLTLGTQYEVQVANVCTGVTGNYSASVNFTTLNITYCTIASNTITDEWISNVTVVPTGAATMSSTSTASNYTDYTADATRLVNLVIGSTNNQISVSKGWSGTQYAEGVSVWIDFNRNGVFESSEQIMSSASSTVTPVTQTFTVPSTAYNGGLNTRMRVILEYNNTPVDPCLSFTYGEVEDYAVKLITTSTVTCYAPSAITFSSVVSTNATVSWTAPTPVPANGYQYYISTTNVAPIATTTPTGSTTSPTINLTGLTPNTTYYVWVRSVCSATDNSTWTAGGSFTTLLNPATLPYYQPFTGPNDFIFINGTQTNKWYYGSAVGNPANSIYISNDNGVTNAYTNNSSSVVQAYRDFIIPTGTTLATFSFDWKSVGENNYDYFRVWLVPTSFTPTAGTQIAAGTGRIQVGTNYMVQSAWQNYFNPTLNISSFAGSTMRLVFEWRNDGSLGTNPPASIDNINLLIPTCQVPTALTTSAITSNTATISWTAASPVPANGYQYYLSTTNTAPTSATIPTGTTTATSVNLIGLLPNTTYYWWVRSKCGGTDASLWMTGVSFTTGQIPATLPYYQPFNGTIDFTLSNGTQTNKWVHGSAEGNPANSIYISNDNGVTNAYSNNSSSVVRAYRDFTIPAGSTLATFLFDWKSVGENNFDYFRVWLVPLSYALPAPGTQITAGAGRIQVGGNFMTQSTWQNYFNPTLNVSSFAGSTMRLVFEWRNDGSFGTNPPASIDNINLLIPTCQVPTALTSNTITASTATISWTAASPLPANGYQYYLSTTNTAPTSTTIPTGSTTATSVNLTGLLPNTTYYWWVRSKCSGTDVSLWMPGGSFMTLQIPATLPYVQPFNGTIDFTLSNGTQTNKWVYGAAVGNTANSIYISNDNGTTNAYSNNSSSVVRAYRDIAIPAGTTTAKFSFDWKSVGENNFDYFRVWLVPLTYTLPAPGTQITAGTGRIQVGTNYMTQSTWQLYNNSNQDLSSFAGTTMRLVFEWRNDGVLGTNPPASIDNIVIARCNSTAPVVTVSPITHNSATVTWPQDPGGATYILRYKPLGATTWTSTLTIAAVPFPTTNNSYTLNNLSPVTIYVVEVAAVCSNTPGVYSHTEFETKCDPTPPGNFTATNITSNSAVITWAPVASAVYVLQYRPVGSPTWTTVNLTANTYTLTGLIPYTTYEVQVASICSGAQNPYTTPLVFTTLPTCEMAPIGLTVTNISMTTAQVDWNAFAGASYVLRYRKVGFTNWTVVNLSTNTYTITGLTEQTQYEVQVANVCSGTMQTYTYPYIFTTPTVVYCNMSGSNNSTEFISNVKVTPNGKPEMTNDSGASGYTDYTTNATKVIELLQGSTGNVISVSKSWLSGTPPKNEAVTVWLDFNRDGIFANSERILVSGASQTTPVTATFSVPSDAFISLTDDKYVVMRVAMKRDGAAEMCTNFNYGEVEDYKVRISKPLPGNLINGKDAITVYPNPAKNVLYITKVKDGANYSIYNAVGQLIQKGLVTGNRISLSNLINGVYIIDINNSGETAQIKFIKE